MKKRHTKALRQMTQDRVEQQLRNIYEINPAEAYSIALAHLRMFNLMTASNCDSDEEYLGKLAELRTRLRAEGLAIRRSQRKK